MNHAARHDYTLPHDYFASILARLGPNPREASHERSGPMASALLLPDHLAAFWHVSVRYFLGGDESLLALARLESPNPTPRAADPASTATAGVLLERLDPDLPRSHTRYALAALGDNVASLPPGNDPDPQSKSKPLSKLYGRLLPERRQTPRSEQLDAIDRHPLTSIFAQHLPERRKTPRSAA
jgi:hypothetical protein